jgi:hypothetical protein
MRRRVRLVGLAAAALVLVLAPTATADDTACLAVVTGTHDNIVVPPGATCFVSGANVRGNIVALQDSRLRVDSSNVGGSIYGEKADVVQVIRTTVRENIIIKEAGPPVGVPGFATCAFGGPFTTCEALVFESIVQEGNVQLEKIHGTVFIEATGVLSPIGGNVKVEDNLASPAEEFMAVEDSRIRQNLQVFKNRGPGLKNVGGNTVGEDLQCFENEPPFFGGGNVARQAQGQCTASPLPAAAAATDGPSVRLLG